MLGSLNKLATQPAGDPDAARRELMISRQSHYEESPDGTVSPKKVKDYVDYNPQPEPELKKKLEYFFLPYNQQQTPYKHMKFDTEPPVMYDFDAINRQM